MSVTDCSMVSITSSMKYKKKPGPLHTVCASVLFLLKKNFFLSSPGTFWFTDDAPTKPHHPDPGCVGIL